MVAWSSDGTVVLAASKSVWPYYEAERAKIEAFSWAVELGQTSGWQRCVFEGDAKVVVFEALNGNVSRAGHNQVLIENILAHSKGFKKVFFSFCFREANMVAHHLARWSASSICSCVWSLGGPACI